MSDVIFKIDYQKLKTAIQNNPRTIRNGALTFMRDSINSYWRVINNTPKWRVGASGGGVPVASGNLRKAHQKEITPFESKIWVDTNKTQAGKWNYAELVAGGTRKMPARNWIKFAKDSMQRNVEIYKQKFLKDVLDNLSKK